MTFSRYRAPLPNADILSTGQCIGRARAAGGRHERRMELGRRSSKLVAIGAAVFVAGAGLVFIGLRRSPAPSQPAQGPTTVVTSPSAEADVVAQGAATAPLSSVKVPSGFEAVAVQLEQVPGLAGYAQPGNLINVYATVKGGKPVARLEPPYSKLVLTKVRVLDVAGGGEAGDPTYLLALAPSDAERLIFFAKFESLWFTLVPDDAPRARTSGLDHADALRGTR